MQLSGLEKFADTLKEKSKLSGQTASEDQLKPLVAELLRDAGEGYGLVIESLTETNLSEHSVRPDIAFYSSALVCGHVELKAPGSGADAPKLKGKHNKAQWKKLKALPNLIYTDGREWTLYRTGERVGPIVRLPDDPTEVGKAAATQEVVAQLETIIRDFLLWKPKVPHRPSELAKYLAPLTRFLRSEVEVALSTAGSGIEALATEWRNFFFPSADNAQFADAYAQTVTYAMLLARLSGATKLDTAEAAKTLDKGNRLLARALELLGQTDARAELRVGFELLQRSLEALDPEKFLKGQPDLWLYFYEEFLAAYDPKLRNDYGVYYTPRAVVEFQVRAVSQLLENRFAKKLGFADDGVLFLDPAVGTGTYPVAAIKHALAKVEAKFGAGAVPARATQMASNMYGFELLVGPYAVAHLRITQSLEGAGADLSGRLKVYLADTLASPNLTPPGGLSLTYKTLTEEHEAARRLKREGEILVCLGNPPYDRDQRANGDEERQRKGGWVRNGDDALDAKQGASPIFEDFLEPARKAGKGLNLQVIFNDYVYFWRWALWRLFEQQENGGIVSFITASSYLSGPGFVGVREVMRRTFDEIWIIDLGGDNLGARKTPNVFNIQTPVAIAVGIRGKSASPDQPAKAWYTKIEGASRQSKLDQLDALTDLSSLEWSECASDWHAPLRPPGKGRYFDWPRVSQIFPFHTAGAVFYRSWPIAENREVLGARWKELVGSESEQRKGLFKESRDRKVSYTVRAASLPGFGQPSVSTAIETTPAPAILEYGFRTFDRQFAFYDSRLGDFIRPAINRLSSDKQTFLIIPDTLVTSLGPAAVATALIPDQHHFRGSFGGKDVIPLYRDADAQEPNLTQELAERLAASYEFEPTVEQVAAYVIAVLGGQSYTSRYWDELETPGPRIPFTKNRSLFEAGCALGEKLLWLQTYAKRFVKGELGSEIPPGGAKSIKPISVGLEKYPRDFAFNAATQEIRVGDGTFGPVAPATWAYEVSGLPVVRSWLAYRMSKRAGRKSSELDKIRPQTWTAAMTSEFLELLWLVEALVNMEPELETLLDEVLSSACFDASELPEPVEDEKALGGEIDADAGGLLVIMAEDSVVTDEDEPDQSEEE